MNGLQRPDIEITLPSAQEVIQRLDAYRPKTAEENCTAAPEQTWDRAGKETICEMLHNVGLQDPEVATVSYSEEVDLDMGGSYEKRHRVLLAKQAGVYLVSHQVTYSERYGYTPDGTTWIIHPEARQPLYIEHEGQLPALGEVSVDTTIPTNWNWVWQGTSRWVEAIQTRRLANRLAALLPADTLRPATVQTEENASHTITAQNDTEISPGLSVQITGKYDKCKIWDSREAALDHIAISLLHDGTELACCTLDVNTLRHRYFPHSRKSYDDELSSSKDWRTKAEALLQLRLSALENRRSAE